MRSMKYSIIIPAYNTGHLIGNCISSIVSQTIDNWEAIVVNNYSTDNTIDIVRSFNDPRIRILDFNNNGVIAASRNKGIQNSEGDWICFLDSDDFWEPDKLQGVAKYVEDYDFIYHDLAVYSDDGPDAKFYMKSWSVKESLVFEDFMINGNPCFNSSVCIRRSLVDKVGFLDESKELVSVEDFDYWIKMAIAGARFKYIPSKLGSYYIGPGNTSSNYKKRIDSIKALYAKYLDRLAGKQRYLAEKRLRFIIGSTLESIDKKKARIEFMQAMKPPTGLKTFKESLLGIFYSLLKRSQE